MNEKDTYTKLVVVFFTIVLVISAIGIIAINEIATENSAPLSEDSVDDSYKAPQKTGTRASSPRTVLAELFTNWGCGNCPTADVAIYELMDVYDSSQLVMISSRINFPSTNDPFYYYNVKDNLDRKRYYDVTGIPVIYFDGPRAQYRVPSDPTATFSKFKNCIDAELTNLSNMTITLGGHLDQVSMNGTVNVMIEVTDTLPIGNLKVKFAVVEDNQYAASPNGEVRHRYVMRDMLDNESLPSLLVGQTYQVSRTFPMDPALNWDSISVVVYVQNEDDKDVLQAALYDYIPQDILVVDDDESTNPTGYEDDYLELLTQMEYSFDGWTLNERGSPSSLDLANYKAVIWITADTSSSTLTTADQTAISDYLDSGRGSLFLSGENVGFDIGASLFYQNYLHSTFIGDDTGESQISGIENDPISDPFFGKTPAITGSSPSEISPIGPATTVFQYSPSGVTGGIKAEHDLNSKVVYFAFMYFEGPNSDSNKMILMERILNWMMNFTNTIPLSEGWNLISIPLIQPDTTLSAVLVPINGEYNSLQWFDSSDPVDPWKHYHDLKPSQLNDLKDITHEFSFWIHITTPGGTIFYYAGDPPSVNQAIDLHIGWNMVGYPSLLDQDRDAALNNINFGSDVDAVWTYNSSSQQWEDLGPSDNFVIGRGYWIHSLVEKAWDVPL